MTRSDKRLSRARIGLLAAMAAVVLCCATSNAAGQETTTRLLDGFESADDWTAVPSDGVAMHLSNEDGPHGQALRIDFDLSGSGYAIVRRKIDVELPPNYAFTFAIRGRASRNNLEFKLVDSSGENVWWYNQRNLEFPTTWTTFSRKKRQISFAWGPLGGGELRRVAAIEIAISAGQGGRGTVWLDDLALTTLPVVSGPPRIVSARAATEARTHAAALVIDGNAATAWRPAGALGSLTMDLGDPREIGGLDITWEKERAPASYTVLASMDGKRWRPIYRAGATWGERALVWTPEAEGRYVRLDLVSTPKAIAGVAEAVVKPLEWAATPNDFAMAAAMAAPRGTYPRSLLGIQSYWTAFGVDRDSSEALLNEDGALEPFSGSFSVEPFVRIGDSLFTWANVDRTPSLPTGFLPFPQLEWTHGSWSLAVAPFEGGTAGTSTTYAQYRMRNNGSDSIRATLALALRAFQVNPPWQFLQTPGGVSPIHSITYAKNRIKVNGQRDVIPLKPPSRVAMSTFDAGDVVERLRSGSLVSRMSVTDSGGRASAVLLYDIVLPPGKSDTVIIALPSAEAVLTRTVAPTADSVAGVLEYQRQRWTTRLTGLSLQLPADATPLVQTLRASLASMLIMRDGPALRPGARSYARSWIRDGAMMAAALLRLGQADVVREYADWYANYQYQTGKVPCCVDARGADPVPENDSHGEFIYLVAEYVRFTGDTAFARQMWRHVTSAVDYIDSLRAQRLTSAYAERDSLPYRGLVPQSISHEGYSAKPMHSYWDDFWTMRGLKDAAELARLLRTPEQARYATMRDSFRRDLVASIGRSMSMHRIEYIPGSVELGDFDATSTTIAVSPVDELAALPTDPVTRTFDRYFAFFERRRDGREKWENYTPYELRLMGTFVRLGDRERAWALARFFLGDQRPAAWRQWAEVVWRNRDEPKFIGDLPHAWVASDFARSFLDFFAFERERDTALVVAAGIPGAWLAQGSTVQIAGMHTYYGKLRLALRREGRTVRVELGGVRVPPGGIVLALPWTVPVRSVRDEGGRDVGEVRGREIRLRSAPAVVIVTYGADPPDR